MDRGRSRRILGTADSALAAIPLSFWNTRLLGSQRHGSSIMVTGSQLVMSGIGLGDAGHIAGTVGLEAG